MDSKSFGDIALQLLSQSQITGSDLDVAICFRNIAKNLSEGLSTIEDLKEGEVE